MTRCTANLLLALGILAAPPLRAQSGDSTGISLHIPDSIGVFANSERKDFDDPSLGTMIRYQRADSLRVDVFVYPGADLAKECPIDCARKFIDAEVDDFISAFPEMIKRGYSDSITVVTRRTLTPAPDDRWPLGRYLRMRMVTKGVVDNSDYYLFYLPGFRLKLRATYPADSASAIAVEDFSHQVVPAFLSRATVAAKGDGKEHIAVNVTLPGTPDVRFTQYLATLVRQGYTIADSSRASGRIVTAPYMGWPIGSEDSPWHGAKSPGVIIAVNVVAKGDSTAVLITGFSPTIPGWTDKSVATQLELMSTMLVAGDGPKDKPK
jgi:hypothetical protein